METSGIKSKRVIACKRLFMQRILFAAWVEIRNSSVFMTNFHASALAMTLFFGTVCRSVSKYLEVAKLGTKQSSENCTNHHPASILAKLAFEESKSIGTTVIQLLKKAGLTGPIPLHKWPIIELKPTICQPFICLKDSKYRIFCAIQKHYNS